ncbi:MAG TPA: glycosyl hydrolase family 18 protein, partial [Candidatus Limnocylindrales bacterium]|nr:glycosyl hydrolase family 18 protein [Candidatus Limnocylindrales bacterium]
MTRRTRATRAAALSLIVLLTGVLVAPAAASEALLAPGAVGMDRQVYGFFDSGDRDYMLETADYDVLTTVAYFALVANADGTLQRVRPNGSPTSEYRAWTSDWMTQVIELAHDHGTDIVLTISRFGWTDSTRAVTVALLSDAAARQRLANQAAAEVVARGVDGVNLDLEPMIGDLKPEFVDLLRRMRAALDSHDPDLVLTFDSTGYSSNYPIAEALADGAADNVFIMAYPFRTRNSDRAGAMSPMGGLSFDVTEATSRIVGLSSPDKVILGLANFGFRWPTETRYLHSLTRKNWATYGNPASSTISRSAELAARHGRRWDSEQLVPWTRWRSRACT